MTTGVEGAKNSYIQEKEVEYDDMIAKDISDF